MSDLTNLLNRWAELGPERCGIDRDKIWVDDGEEHTYIGGRPITDDKITPENIVWEWYAKFVLQVAVQNAIEQNGWEYALLGGHDVPNMGRVFPDGTSEFEAVGDSGAEALLAAHIQTLENYGAA